MRANHVLPLMLAAPLAVLIYKLFSLMPKTPLCLQLKIWRFPQMTWRFPPRIWPFPPGHDRHSDDMTVVPTSWTQVHTIKNLNLYALHGKTVGAETSIWAVGEKSKEAHFTTTSNKSGRTSTWMPPR